MPATHAAMYGACLGLLAGIVISLLFNLDMTDSLYRTGILAVCGAWMGMLLSWLNSLLPVAEEPSDNDRPTGQSRRP